MGKFTKITKTVKEANEIWTVLPGDTKKALAKKAGEKLKEKLKDIKRTEDDFKNDLKEMSNVTLEAMYIPDVYQKDIYMIDYEKLKDYGIKLISFDIDDTIVASGAEKLPQTVFTLFKDLKRMGFEVVLLTNAKDERGENFAEQLEVDYVTEAKKPYNIGFQTVIVNYEAQHQEVLKKTQIAHIGNHLTEDIMRGNIFGITTCLVRRIGKLGKAGGKMKEMAGINENHIVREELKKRDLWSAHHVHKKDDQYYQLGEMPKYLAAKK